MTGPSAQDNHCVRATAAACSVDGPSRGGDVDGDRAAASMAASNTAAMTGGDAERGTTVIDVVMTSVGALLTVVLEWVVVRAAKVETRSAEDGSGDIGVKSRLANCPVEWYHDHAI